MKPVYLYYIYYILVVINIKNAATLFAVELRKSFVDYETSPDFTSAWL